ncbi:MAG: T9SS type A sorting domain-containing protein, partial [Candidatus Cloacimonetes bacterium]|nr:T9SS type A sorting domain-containing protein [Candidatus Cloacimonadota bacterium]
LFGALHSEHINLVSKSLPELGIPEDFCKYGDYGLFVGGSHHLAIVDFDEPSGMPIAVLEIPGINDQSSQVLCYGNYAYLYLYKSIYVISLQDIRHPIVVNVLDLGANHRGGLIRDDILYIATSLGFLSSYKLSDPELPISMDSIGISNFARGYMVAGDGFIVCQGDSLLIVDTSDPYDLRPCIALAYSDSSQEYQDSRIAAMGQYLICNSLNELRVYSLANPDAPILISSTILDCADLIYRTHIHDNVLWSLYRDPPIDSDEIGLMAIDLSNPNSPVTSLKHSMKTDWEHPSLFMRASGDRMVFIHSEYSPESLRTAVLSGSSYTLSDYNFQYDGIWNIVANDTWIAGFNSVFNVLDYRSDSSLYPTKSIEPVSLVGNLLQLKDKMLLDAYSFVYNDETYGAYAPALNIYDLQTGNKLSSFPLPVDQSGNFFTNPLSIEIYNNHALLSNHLGGLVCLDISDPANPSQLYWLMDPFHAVYQSAVRGNELWLATYVNMAGGYLRCYDISEFASPILKYQINLGDVSPDQMLIMGDYLYVKLHTYLRCYRLGADSILAQNDYFLAGIDLKYMLPLGKGILLGGDERMIVLSLRNPLHPEQTGSQRLEWYQSHGYNPYYYLQTQYAVNKHNVLVADGTSLKCFDASLAAAMCEADLDFETQALQVFPNPGRGEVSIGYQAASTGSASVEIYNLRGQKMKSTRINSTMEGLNIHQLVLTDDDGRKLAAGIYILKVRAGAIKQTSKLVVTQ